jgi:hypothetical protein
MLRTMQVAFYVSSYVHMFESACLQNIVIPLGKEYRKRDLIL